MKNLYLAIAGALTLAACSSDDSSAPVNQNPITEQPNTVDIIGTWTEVDYQWAEGEEWIHLGDCQHWMFEWRYEFMPNGQMIMDSACGEESDPIILTYTYENNIVTYSEEGMSGGFKITPETSTTVIARKFYMEDGEPVYTSKYRLKKQ